MQANYPSIKTIMRIEGTTLESAKLVRTILKAHSRNELECLPVYDTYYTKIGCHMYNPHSKNELKMQLIDIAINGCGVEAFKTDNRGYVDYINLGDTYDLTVCYFDGRFIVCSWGDIAEKYCRFED